MEEIILSYPTLLQHMSETTYSFVEFSCIAKIFILFKKVIIHRVQAPTSTYCLAGYNSFVARIGKNGIILVFSSYRARQWYQGLKSGTFGHPRYGPIFALHICRSF